MKKTLLAHLVFITISTFSVLAYASDSKHQIIKDRDSRTGKVTGTIIENSSEKTLESDSLYIFCNSDGTLSSVLTLSVYTSKLPEKRFIGNKLKKVTLNFDNNSNVTIDDAPIKWIDSNSPVLGIQSTKIIPHILESNFLKISLLNEDGEPLRPINYPLHNINSSLKSFNVKRGCALEPYSYETIAKNKRLRHKFSALLEYISDPNVYRNGIYINKADWDRLDKETQEFFDETLGHTITYENPDALDLNQWVK